MTKNLPTAVGAILMFAQLALPPNSAQAAGAMVRLTNTGAVDTTFNSTGQQVSPPTASRHVMVARWGTKLFVAGGVDDGVPYPGSIWYLGRKNSDGSADTAFGYGGVTTASYHVGPNDYTRWASLGMAAGAKPVIFGDTTPNNSISHTSYLVRFNENGTIDTTFGSQGFVEPFHGLGPFGANTMIIAPDETIYVFSWADSSHSVPAKMAKISASGVVLATANFGPCGRVADPMSVAVTSGGQLIVVGAFNVGTHNIVVERLSGGLVPDTNFATASAGQCPGGAAYVSAIEGYTTAMGIDGSDRIVVAAGEQVSPKINFFRLNGLGQADGWSGSFSFPASSAIRPLRRITTTATGNYMLAAVGSFNGSLKFISTRLSQFMPAGLDTTYGPFGYKTISFAGYGQAFAYDYLLDTSQRMTIVGDAW
jgi:uncharacterized delta-60 repeat protein